jgi:hypothetical protein
MTADEVMARLGAPDSVDAGGSLHWRQEQYSGNFVTLVVLLDENRRVISTGVGSHFDTAADYPSIPNWQTNRNDVLAHPYNPNNQNPTVPQPP